MPQCPQEDSGILDLALINISCVREGLEGAKVNCIKYKSCIYVEENDIGF